MPAAWQKRYGFRLRESDQELITLLEQTPPAKKSDVIRHLLSFAYRTLTERKEAEKQIEVLTEEIREVKKAQEQQYQELRRLLLQAGEYRGQDKTQSKKHDHIPITDNAVKQSAEALLSFGKRD